MFICLSSGASPRYRQDILRALAIPAGSELQFRYDHKWIEPSILTKVSTKQDDVPECLIAYIDQRDSTKQPELVPVRFARFSGAEVHGSTASLTFALGDYAHSRDLKAFNGEMRSIFGSKLPTWSKEKKITGCYWFESESEPQTVRRSRDLTVWEQTTAQIALSEEFAAEDCFYSVLGIFKVGSGVEVIPRNCCYELERSTEFELHLYHFHPNKGTQEVGLRVATGSKSIVFTSNAVLNIDSRYDLKRIRFRAGKPTSKEDGVLSIYRIGVGDTNQLGSLEFDLRVSVPSCNRLATFGIGTGIGVALAFPHFLAAVSDPDLSLCNIASISIGAFLAGVVAGNLAAFGLRKGI